MSSRTCRCNECQATRDKNTKSERGKISICKRNIARVKTVIRQRELGLAKAPEKEATKKSTKKTAKVDAEVKG